MSRHTPGPWYIGIDKVSVWGTVKRVGREPTIARCIEPLERRSIREANACLIAKAPEMYAILKKILANYTAEHLDSVSQTTCGTEIRTLLREIEGEIT